MLLTSYNTVANLGSAPMKTGTHAKEHHKLHRGSGSGTKCLPGMDSCHTSSTRHLCNVSGCGMHC
jgi:hypothetical protein